MTSRRRNLPIDDSGSWRIVEGENDSFDTSILPNYPPSSQEVLNGLSPSTSGHPSFVRPSQRGDSNLSPLATQSFGSSFGRSFGGSQEDRDRPRPSQEELLKDSFQPSLRGMREEDSREERFESRGGGAGKREVPTFRMPMVDVDGRRAGRKGARRRNVGTGNSSRQTRRRKYEDEYSDDDRDDEQQERDSSLQDLLSRHLPRALRDVLIWALRIIILSFSYASKPLAFLLAIYLSLGSLIIAQNILTTSIQTSLSPLCRIPFASSVIPFCPASSAPSFPSSPVEFDDLMGVQGKFEEVLEKSGEGVSLPMEMKRSETAVRDLRTLVGWSEIREREELVGEFDGYIELARRAAGDLQRFNTHVGGAVDHVISINRWTSKFIDSLAPPEDTRSLQSPSGLSRFASWIFHPFTPTIQVFDEQALLTQYMEHTTLVSSRITTLILEAQQLLRTLEQAESHLSIIHGITSRSSSSLSGEKSQLLWNLWTILGSPKNRQELSSVQLQLELLKRVESQRGTAVAQISAVILELEGMQVELEDLRDKVAAPGVVGADISRGEAGVDSGRRKGGGGVPLAVHVDTIDRGVERLESARRRIRAVEDDRVREALQKAGVGEEKLLES